MINTKNKEAMLYAYAQNDVRKLVYHLSQAGSDGSAYDAAFQILKTAVKDHDAGHDPGHGIAMSMGASLQHRRCPLVRVSRKINIVVNFVGRSRCPLWTPFC